MARIDQYGIEISSSFNRERYYLDSTKTAESTRISHKTWKKARKINSYKCYISLVYRVDILR